MAPFRTASLAILLLVFAFAPAATAGTYTLANPAVGGFWDEPSTWLEDGVPATTPPGEGDAVQLTGSGATVTVRTNVHLFSTDLEQNCACTLQINSSASGALLRLNTVTITAGTVRTASTIVPAFVKTS
jgi:hypothetical protein